MENSNNHLELEKKVQLLESVLELANEGYWEWDILNNKITFSPAWYTLLNYEPYEIPQSFETFETLLHPDDKEKILEAFNTNIKQNTGCYKFEFRMVKKSGEVCWILSRGNIERDNKGKPLRMAGTHADITDYKSIDERINHLNSFLSAIHDINQIIITEKDKNSLLNKTCEILCRTRGFNLVWIGEIEENNYKVVSKAFCSFNESNLTNVKWDDSPSGQGPTGESIRTGKTCVVNDINQYVRFKPWIKSVNRFGFNSAIALPLSNNGKIFGNLTIYSKYFNHFDGKEISLLKEVAVDLSFAVHALELEEKRKKAEEALRLSNRYNRSLIEASLDPLVTIGPDGKITDVNTSTESVTGCSRRELVGTDFSDYFTEPEKAQKGYQQVFKESWVRDYPLEIIHKNKGITPVLYNASVYRDESGEVIGVLAAARDVTELKKAEEEIQRLANVVEHSDDAIVTKDLDGVIISWNKGAELLYGYTADEIKGKNVSILTPNPLNKEINQFIGRIKNGERVFHYETRRVGKYGKEIDISLTLSPVIDKSNELVGISAIARDISERKRAEKKLELANKYNRSLIEANPDPLVTIGPDGKITDVNTSTESVTGCSRRELVGTDFSDYFTEPEKAQKGYQEVFREGKVRDYPLEIKHKDGGITPVLYNASVYRDEGGEVIGVFAAARDVTELKKAEDEIKTSLEEKEILLREVHHRVKNNLQIISSLLDLQANYVDDAEAVNVLQESQNRVKSMAIIHEMLYQSNDLASINFSNYIKSLVHDLFCSYGVKSNIKFVIDVEKVFLNIETAIPCGLIISELVSNSLKYAFPDENVAGEVFIRVCSLSKGFELVVSDNGAGFPKNLDFKNVQTSLGLRLVNMLVNQLEGSIKLENVNGTTFKIKFKELNYKKRF